MKTKTKTKHSIASFYTLDCCLDGSSQFHKEDSDLIMALRVHCTTEALMYRIICCSDGLLGPFCVGHDGDLHPRRREPLVNRPPHPPTHPRRSHKDQPRRCWETYTLPKIGTTRLRCPSPRGSSSSRSSPGDSIRDPCTPTSWRVSTSSDKGHFIYFFPLPASAFFLLFPPFFFFLSFPPPPLPLSLF